MEKIGRYSSHKSIYGEDIRSLVQNLKNTEISKPDDIDHKSKDKSTKRIQEKEVNEYVKQLSIYKSITKNLYSMV